MVEKNILWQKVDESLNSVRPYLQRDGGDVRIVDITDENIVMVQLTGACETCPQSFMTMKTGIEETVKKDVPQIKAVQAIEPFVKNFR